MRRNPKRERGQTAVMFTLGLTTMFGMVGLVSDIGWAYYRKEAAQAAAQAAATATVKAAIAMSGGTCGTNHVVCQSETSCPSSVSGYGTTNVDKGCLYAQTNGFTTAGKQKVAIQTGTGAYNGVTVTYWAVVKVSEEIPQLFSVVTGNTKASLTARSIVGYIPPTNGGCIYVTAPHGAALTTNGNTSISSGCGIQVNSDASNAIDLSGGNTNIAVTGTTNGQPNQVDIVGGYNCYGGHTGCISPSPTTGVVSDGDPLSGIDPPTDGACSSPPNLGSHDTVTVTNPGTITYCGSLSLGSNSSLTLGPGNYIFKGSSGCGLSVTAQANLTANGAFLYFENPCSVRFSGNGNINMSAPSSGTYQGVLMYQDRNNPQTAQLTGGSNQIVNGVLYFPDALLKFSGNGSSVDTSGATSIVAYNLELDGNAFIKNSGSSPYLNTFTGYAIIE